MNKNLGEVVEEIDAKVFVKTERHLIEAEIALLRGAGQGKTYDQIARTSRFGEQYLKQNVGPKLWRLLTEVLGREVTKTNFRIVLEQEWGLSCIDNVQNQEVILPELEVKVKADKSVNLDFVRSKEVATNNVQDWGKAPDVSVFYGRTAELGTLKQWIVQERCRLIAIVGMGGMGKTTLAVRCAQQLQGEFESLVWRSLHHAPPLEELLTDLLECLSSQQVVRLPESLNEQIALLVKHFQKSRCLLILDSVEAILQRGGLAGHYQEGYEGYRDLFKQVVESPHQSCLMLTSLEKPREIAAWLGKGLPVHSLQLMGLQEEAWEIFRQADLLSSDQWETLTKVYRGNPLALKIVATTIRELFSGRVNEFFKFNTIIFGDIRDIIEEQFERLSALEQEILYWLAINFQPISLEELQGNIVTPVFPADLLEALDSLLRRGLIETNIGEQTLFALQQPVITEYVTEQLIEQVCEEIQEVCRSQKIQNFKLVRNHILVKRQPLDEDIKALQARLILMPVMSKLYIAFRDEKLIEEQLVKVLCLLQEKSSLAVGYARENLQLLLAQLKADESISASLRAK